MKVVLIVTLMIMGQDKPTQQAGELPDLATCEVEAHHFMTHEFPAEVQSKIVFRSAACAIGLPGKDA